MKERALHFSLWALRPVAVSRMYDVHISIYTNLSCQDLLVSAVLPSQHGVKLTDMYSDRFDSTTVEGAVRSRP